VEIPKGDMHQKPPWGLLLRNPSKILVF